MLRDSGHFMLFLEVQLWLLFFLSTQISDLTQNGWFATDDLGWMFSHKFHAEVKVVPTAPSMVFQRLDNITETHTLTLKNQYVSLFWSTKDWRLATTCHDLSFFATSEWGRDEINFKNVGRIWLDWKVGDNTTVYQYPPCSTRCSARVQAFSEHGAFSRPTSAHTDVSPRPFPRMLQPAMATVDAPTPNP